MNPRLARCQERIEQRGSGTVGAYDTLHYVRTMHDAVIAKRAKHLRDPPDPADFAKVAAVSAHDRVNGHTNVLERGDEGGVCGGYERRDVSGPAERVARTRQGHHDGLGAAERTRCNDVYHDPRLLRGRRGCRRHEPGHYGV